MGAHAPRVPEPKLGGMKVEDAKRWWAFQPLPTADESPSPGKIDAFLANESIDSFANVVERLLASPHYGVQWGRHWLDVVRYADTAGENTDRPLPHA